MEGLIVRSTCRFIAHGVTGLLPISRCDKILLLTLSVTRADIVLIIEASTAIKFSLELINNLLNIRNLNWVISTCYHLYAESLIPI